MTEGYDKTRRKARRIVADCVSRNNKFNCDHKERGCDAVLELGAPKKHVENCEFMPVSCSNKGCNDVINKRDVQRHELELCRFKATTCGVCCKTMPQYEYDTHGCALRRDLSEIKKDLADMKATQREMMNEIRQGMQRMTTVFETLEKSCRNVSDVSSTRNTDIVVVGGSGSGSKSHLSSVERFSLLNQTWTPLGELEEKRHSTAAVLFENLMLVCGGSTSNGPNEYTDTIEVLDTKENTTEWKKFDAKMPMKVSCHKCVVHGNKLLIIGGRTEDRTILDTIYEVLLVPPYSSKLLCHMKRKRADHGVELFDDKVLIAGGANEVEAESSVEIFDITRNKCIEMPPLPSPVHGLATVRRDDSMLLIGGMDEEGNDKKEIIEYDHQTGQSKVLLFMETELSGCCAVYHENKLFVIGFTEDDDHVVTCFNFSLNSWNELPLPAETRALASAVIVEM